MIPLDVNVGTKEGKPGIEVNRWVSRVLAKQEPVHTVIKPRQISCRQTVIPSC